MECKENNAEQKNTNQTHFNVRSSRSLKPATLLKKRLWHGCFPVNFAKFLRTPFLTEHLRQLLLKCQNNFKCQLLMSAKNKKSTLSKITLILNVLSGDGMFLSE